MITREVVSAILCTDVHVPNVHSWCVIPNLGDHTQQSAKKKRYDVFGHNEVIVFYFCTLYTLEVPVSVSLLACVQKFTEFSIYSVCLVNSA